MGKSLMVNDLTLLADRYGCDKGSLKHNYTEIYDKYLKDMRNDKFNFLEIGFGEGASVKMWLNYFPRVVVYCADIRKDLPNDPILLDYVSKGRLKFFSVDQSYNDQMSCVIDDCDNFRVILDDGSHAAEDQQNSFGYLFMYLSSKGLYIIEDLNCKRSPNPKFDVVAKRTVKVLHGYNESRNFNSLLLTEDQTEYINKNINEVSIYKDKISFIRKI